METNDTLQEEETKNEMKSPAPVRIIIFNSVMEDDVFMEVSKERGSH